MSRNDTTPARTPEVTARLLAERFFPKEAAKALRAAELIASSIREAVEVDRWARIQEEEWGCAGCGLTCHRRELVHKGLRELCPRCGLPAATVDRVKLARAEERIKELEHGTRQGG